MGMKKLNPTLVRTITHAMNGARRAKFEASVKILNDSLAQGAWVTRGSVKANSGFYQGLYSKRSRHANHGIDMCLSYGSMKYAKVTTPEVLGAANLNATELAWIELCLEVDAARKELDAARPVPKVTAIGLSPKVTKTFQECNLDLDIASIKPAEIAFYEVQDYDAENKPKVDREGKPVMKRVYYVKWSEGILHGQSRFNHGCEACGKTIPSGRFVPIEANCKKLGKVSLWVGCDCASNIFGIKDAGIDKNAKGPV